MFQKVIEPDELFSVWLLVGAGVYIAILLTLGMAGRWLRRSNSPGDFFLAGRSLGFLTLLLTLYATQYSGNTFVGYAAQGYRLGPAFMYGILTLGIVPSIYLLFGPKLRKIASKNNLITLGDYIQHRYGSRPLTTLVSLASTVALINFIITNLIAIGIIVEILTGGRVSYEWGVILLALVVVVYEILGGLRSVAWTDIIQGVLILAGSIILVVGTLVLLGGLEPALELLRTDSPQLLEPPDLGNNITWISSIIVFGIGIAIYPHAIQRLYAARSTSSLKLALSVMVFLPLLTTLPAITWGFLGNGIFPGLSTAESGEITPLILERLVSEFPAFYWIAVILFIAILGAIMSTMDSALLSSSSALVTDFVPIAEKRRINVAKVVSVALMAVAIIVALLVRGGIFGLIELKFELLLPCAPSLFLGLYWRRLKAAPLLAGFIAGLALTAFLLLAGGVAELVPERPFDIHAGLWGLGLNLAVVLIAHRLLAFRNRYRPAK